MSWSQPIRRGGGSDSYLKTRRELLKHSVEGTSESDFSDHAGFGVGDGLGGRGQDLMGAEMRWKTPSVQGRDSVSSPLRWASARGGRHGSEMVRQKPAGSGD